jgi:hypothetical protein
LQHPSAKPKSSALGPTNSSTYPAVLEVPDASLCTHSLRAYARKVKIVLEEDHDLVVAPAVSHPKDRGLSGCDLET